MAESDGIARLEACYLVSGLGNNAGTVTAENCRQCIGIKDATTAQLGIYGINTGSLDLHLDLPGLGYFGFMGVPGICER
jgi:hypothetical protein